MIAADEPENDINTPVWAIGLMSGTSMDGIDAALLKTDGHVIERAGPAMTVAYEPALRDELEAAIIEAGISGKGSCDLQDVEEKITDAHADVVTRLLDGSGLAPDDVAVIGFHGHTVVHEPENQRSWQIGNGARLAMRSRISVINDFRSHDMDLGGQGAPLTPLYHAALLRRRGNTETCAVLNIGGVANVTWIGVPRDEGGPHIVAFDTGPGNALVDDWMVRHMDKPFDEDGRTAARGVVHEEILNLMMDHPYFDDMPPKSLDRNAFSSQPAMGLSATDGAATLTAFTVESIIAAQMHFPAPVEAWYVCGGGRHNRTMMQGLRDRTPVLVDPVEVLTWRGDFLEAEAFAFLAVRSRRGLPISLPETTGASEPATGGVLHHP